MVNMRIQKKHQPVVLRPGMEAGLIDQPHKKETSKS